MQESFKNYNESFANTIKSWSEKSPLTSGFGWDKIISLHKANAKAIADVAQAISEGSQALVRRQTEILQKNAEDMTKFLKEVSSARSPEDGIAKQADFAKSAVDSAMANSCELIEISSKFQNEARDIITKRVSSAISELSQNGASSSKGVTLSEPVKESKRKSEAA